MLISPICDRCKKELIEYGGIIFGPPDHKGKVKKDHLCRRCYWIVIGFIERAAIA